MQKANQTGRSMIEMLGVLAIIGVLSVGSLSVIAKARQEHLSSQLLSQVNNLITEARKMSCDYEDGYQSYANMLFQSKAMPDGVQALGEDGEHPTPDSEVITTGKATGFLLAGDTVLEMNALSSGDRSIVAILSYMPETVCTALASASWGKKHTNGFLGASFGAVNTTDDKQLDPNEAATGCAEENPTLTLVFQGCPIQSSDETE